MTFAIDHYLGLLSARSGRPLAEVTRAYQAARAQVADATPAPEQYVDHHGRLIHHGPRIAEVEAIHGAIEDWAVGRGWTAGRWPALDWIGGSNEDRREQ